MKASLKQIQSHGVKLSKYPFASYCCGRGWRGHKTWLAAHKAAWREATKIQKEFGGGYPQILTCRTDTGELI